MHSKNNPTANTAQNLLTAGRSSWLGNVNVAAFGTKYQVIHRAGSDGLFMQAAFQTTQSVSPFELSDSLARAPGRCCRFLVAVVVLCCTDRWAVDRLV